MKAAFATAFCLSLFLNFPCFSQEDDSSDNEGIYGYSSLEVMSDTSIIGYTETDLDPSVASYYSAFVQGELKDGNGNVITYQTVRGSDGQQIAAVTIEYDNATPQTNYTLTGSHRAVVEISDPCQGCNYSYLDYFDYEVYGQDLLDLEDEYAFLQQGSPQPSPNVIDLGSTHETAQATTPGACNDVRDQIINEYVTYQVGYSPTCASFSQTASTANFSFGELNSGDYTWAILQQSLLTGAEQVRSINGNQPLTVN